MILREKVADQETHVFEEKDPGQIEELHYHDDDGKKLDVSNDDCSPLVSFKQKTGNCMKLVSDQ